MMSWCRGIKDALSSVNTSLGLSLQPQPPGWKTNFNTQAWVMGLQKDALYLFVACTLLRHCAATGGGPDEPGCLQRLRIPRSTHNDQMRMMQSIPLQSLHVQLLPALLQMLLSRQPEQCGQQLLGECGCPPQAHQTRSLLQASCKKPAHRGISKYYQSASKALAQVLYNFRVQQDVRRLPCSY